ncbi:putative tetratricopeptide-like helical domain superfamily, DYW domain-containing protein [Helianthus annuus]|nr:putative tetratricopeptide-like helical domain superfamily, DYW domain-containing protein [Helianthus annuus]
MLIRVHATARTLPSTIIHSNHSPNSHHQWRFLHHKHSPQTTHNPHHPSNLTNRSPLEYQSILKTFIARRAIQPGRQLHAHLCVKGFGYDTILGTKLVDLYCSCNYLSNAHQLFDKIPKRNVFLWNVLIRGYAWNGPYNNAVSLYYNMIDHGVVPDNFTFPFVLKACSNLSAIDVGRDVHEHVVRTGWETDVFVGAALIDMYAKCGDVGSARQVFDKIVERDVVMWNSMLAAYAQNGRAEECLVLCGDMALCKMRPTVATLVTAISSAADTAALPQGRELHAYSWRQGFEVQDKVKTALVDMYAKSGSVKVARNLFNMLMEKRVVSWNAMITGYAMHGYATEALALFNKMTCETQPDHITFVGVLSACNHGGLLNKGKELFDLMIREYNIKPTVQHYSSMVDLIGHYGRLEEAYDMIKNMTIRPDSGIWGALLNSCKIHGNVELGELALEKLIELEPDEAGNYVIMSNIYAQAGKWEGVAKIRELMTNKKLKKDVACSWIEVNNKVHAFLSGDTSHPMCDAIDDELKRIEKLMVEAGYVPNIAPVFHDVDDDEKMKMVCRHSERLAIAFGIISTPPKSKLLITKNLRVCEDCHVAIKFISKITEREIVFRDVNRYHHFKDGVCSCGDYW